MIELGIVLFLIGALVAYFAAGQVAQLGFAVAVVGVVLIVLGAVFAIGDSAHAQSVPAYLRLL